MDLHVFADTAQQWANYFLYNIMQSSIYFCMYVQYILIELYIQRHFEDDRKHTVLVHADHLCVSK